MNPLRLLTDKLVSCSHHLPSHAFCSQNCPSLLWNSFDKEETIKSILVQEKASSVSLLTEDNFEGRLPVSGRADLSEQVCPIIDGSRG